MGSFYGSLRSVDVQMDDDNKPSLNRVWQEYDMNYINVNIREMFPFVLLLFCDFVAADAGKEKHVSLLYRPFQ